MIIVCDFLIVFYSELHEFEFVIYLQEEMAGRSIGSIPQGERSISRGGAYT